MIKCPLSCLILIFILICFGNAAQAQVNSDSASIISIAPANLFDPLTGTLQFGIQKRFNKRMAVSADYGFKLNTFSYYAHGGRSDRLNYRYSKIKLELKYFIRPQRRHNNDLGEPYFAIQWFYFPQRYSKDSSWLLTDKGSFKYAYSNIRRRANAFSLVSGHQKVKGRYVFDTYLGFGIRIINIRHSPFNLVPEQYFSKGIFSESLDYKEGTFFRPHLVFGFKMGYMLNWKIATR